MNLRLIVMCVGLLELTPLAAMTPEQAQFVNFDCHMERAHQQIAANQRYAPSFQLQQMRIIARSGRRFITLSTGQAISTGQAMAFLHDAAIRGDCAMLKSLLNQGIHVDLRNQYGDTALHMAVSHNQEEAVQILLAYSANVNACNQNANTPLHVATWKPTPYLAAQYSNANIVKELVAAGANLNARHLYGDTPLHMAIGRGKTNIVEKLLKIKNIDINVQNIYKSTPLAVAVYENNEVIVDLLLAKGAEVNTPIFDGRTPLHLAVQGGYVVVIRKLIDAGADLRKKTQNGLTALDVARGRGDKKIIALLKQYTDEHAIVGNTDFIAALNQPVDQREDDFAIAKQRAIVFVPTTAQSQSMRSTSTRTKTTTVMTMHIAQQEPAAVVPISTITTTTTTPTAAMPVVQTDHARGNQGLTPKVKNKTRKVNASVPPAPMPPAPMIASRFKIEIDKKIAKFPFATCFTNEHMQNIRALQYWPNNEDLDVKQLHGGNIPQYRLRLGNYRLVFEVNGAARIITIIMVGLRKKIYDMTYKSSGQAVLLEQVLPE